MCGDWCLQASLLLREGWASLASSVLLKLAAAQKVGIRGHTRMGRPPAYELLQRAFLPPMSYVSSAFDACLIQLGLSTCFCS